MIRSTCLLIVLPFLTLIGCQRESVPPVSQTTPAPSPTPVPDANAAPPQTTSEIIHKWRLPEPGKYTCPEGYRLDVIPHKDRQPDKPLVHCRSIKNPALPAKPVITKSP